ncbi:MAG TPA: NUDIX hydrolase [Blastocatellia bacterium]|nr:NUDIX hydrolase [Blastocatellia bacterium]
MYITAEVIRALEKKFGLPDELHLAYEMKPQEFDMVLRSRKHGRAHDVTLYIIKDNQIAVIKKPMYPPGAYRAPSGGVAPGENFEAGATREAYEETGLEIRLERYLLRARVRFTCKEQVINWTSHVFTATPVSGELQPVDTHEIVEARFATVDELMTSVRDTMLASGSTGLRYRAELNDAVIAKLIEYGIVFRF